MGIFLTISMIILLVFGFPMFILLLLPTFFSMELFFAHIPIQSLIQRIAGGVEPFPLVAVPLFIFSADIMVRGDMSRRLVNFAEKIVGHLTGGLAHTTILACGIFGAISGSNQAAVAAIGGNMHDSLIERGYKQSFSTALIVNASDLSQLIPPSILLIMFGVITGSSVGALFLAGIGPAVVLGLGFMFYCRYWAKKNNIPLRPRASLLEIFRAFLGAAIPIGLAVIIIGGIYGGIFTPTEAAGVAVLYALLSELLIFKTIRFRDIYKVALKSGKTTALVFILIGAAETFAWMLTIARIPRAITEFMLTFAPSPIIFLLIMNVIFFIALMFFNPLSAMVILTPLFFPVARAFGIDPLHMGALIALNGAVGSATPPFGVDLFTACAVFKLPYEKVVKGVFPFIAIGLLTLILLSLIPQIATFLPNLVF